MKAFSQTAIFGGSFDPPHLGHEVVIRELKTEVGFSNLFILPSFGTPLKNAQSSFTHRFQMAKIAFQSLSEVSALEEEHQFKFTWNLLEYFNQKKMEVTVVIGTDQLNQIEKWARFPEVLTLSHWLILKRKPIDEASLAAKIKTLVAEGLLIATSDMHIFEVKNSNRKLTLFDTKAPAFSSTQVRELFAKKETEILKTYLKPEIYQYIERNHLYGT